MLSTYKHQYATILQKTLPEMAIQQVDAMIELPPANVSADFAFPCFQLAKALKKSPMEVAKEIVGKILSFDRSNLRSFESAGPYVNATIQTNILSAAVFSTIETQKETYGKGLATGKTIVIESPGPNTNKPLHLGHVRNMLLGNALAAVATFAGHTVRKVDIINDRGVHICKSMLAYQRFKKNMQPDKKSDHFVGDCYVEYSKQAELDPSLEKVIHDMLLAREAGDPAVRALRKMMNERAITGMQATYRRYGTHIDKAYYESDIYLTGKDIVLKSYEKGIFTKDEKGNIIFKNDNLKDKKVVLRADGTSVYATQDIALVDERFKDRHPDAMVYVVGNEQTDHFKALFEICKALEYPFADKCYHLSYGMISLPEGRMKSRQGTVVDADNLADDVQALATEKIQERQTDLTSDLVTKKAEAIAMGAIKFFILKYEPDKNFVFNPKESLAFEGETGPYIQYTHARCCSIVGKFESSIDTKLHSGNGTANSVTMKQCNYETASPVEHSLLASLAQFPDIVQEAAALYKPNLIAKYLFDLAQTFNTFYTQTKVITDNADETSVRVRLVACVQQVLQNGLGLLGIEAPEMM